jgi:hypothetical protein
MKNRKKIERFEKEFEALSVEELVVIAQEEYTNSTEDSARMKAALCQRRWKLNETFEWTAENKERLLLLNTKLMNCFEKLRIEITKACQVLQKRVDTSDDFLQDFEIEAFVRPRFRNAEDDSMEEIDDSMTEILEDACNDVFLSFTLNSAQSIDDALYFNYDLNWNHDTPQLQGHFDEHYISYGIHELFDHIKGLSCSDILKINRLTAEYRVTCQHFTEFF